MNKDIENILDECLERILINNETVEQCLQHYPKHAVELKPLLETAATASVVASIQPGLEFRNRARYQMQTALRDMELKKSRSFFNWNWQPRWAMATVTIALVLLLSGGGTVAAAAGSMPDNTLYPVKLATEQARLAFTFSGLGKAELYTELADIRVNEIVYLAENNKPEGIEQTANRLDSYLTAIVALSLTEKADGAEEGFLAMTAPQQNEEPVSAYVPAPSETDEIKEATAVTEETTAVTEDSTLITRATSETPLLQAGSGENVIPDRRTELAIMVANQANTNLSRLYALLEEIPESSRPALLQTINKLDVNYQAVIDSLSTQ